MRSILSVLILSQVVCKAAMAVASATIVSIAKLNFLLKGVAKLP